MGTPTTRSQVTARRSSRTYIRMRPGTIDSLPDVRPFPALRTPPVLWPMLTFAESTATSGRQWSSPDDATTDLFG
jgi:hypothetical protein